LNYNPQISFSQQTEITLRSNQCYGSDKIMVIFSIQLQFKWHFHSPQYLLNLVNQHSFFWKHMHITPNHETTSDFFHINWNHCNAVSSPSHGLVVFPQHCIPFRLMVYKSLWVEVRHLCIVWILLLFGSLACSHC